MRRRLAYFSALLVLVIATASSAANEGPWPTLLHSDSCADAFDTVSLIAFDRYLQTSGSPDTLCDHDKRIPRDTISVSTVYGPIPMQSIVRSAGFVPGSIRVLVTSSVVGGGGDWDVRVVYRSPIDQTTFVVLDELSADRTGVTTAALDLGVGASVNGQTNDAYPTGIPSELFIEITLVTATSWLGDIALVFNR